jgi:hypothetical protein
MNMSDSDPGQEDQREKNDETQDDEPRRSAADQAKERQLLTFACDASRRLRADRPQDPPPSPALSAAGDV